MDSKISLIFYFFHLVLDNSFPSFLPFFFCCCARIEPGQSLAPLIVSAQYLVCLYLLSHMLEGDQNSLLFLSFYYHLSHEVTPDSPLLLLRVSPCSQAGFSLWSPCLTHRCVRHILKPVSYHFPQNFGSTLCLSILTFISLFGDLSFLS